MSKIKILKANHNTLLLKPRKRKVVDYMSKIKILKANHNRNLISTVINSLLTICQR